MIIVTKFNDRNGKCFCKVQSKNLGRRLIPWDYSWGFLQNSIEAVKTIVSCFEGTALDYEGKEIYFFHKDEKITINHEYFSKTNVSWRNI